MLSNSFINIPKSLLTKILLNFHESNRVHLRAVSLIHAVSQEGWRFGSNCLWILQGERCNLLYWQAAAITQIELCCSFCIFAVCSNQSSIEKDNKNYSIAQQSSHPIFLMAIHPFLLLAPARQWAPPIDSDFYISFVFIYCKLEINGSFLSRK